MLSRNRKDQLHPEGQDVGTQRQYPAQHSFTSKRAHSGEAGLQKTAKAREGSWARRSPGATGQGYRDRLRLGWYVSL